MLENLEELGLPSHIARFNGKPALIRRSLTLNLTLIPTLTLTLIPTLTLTPTPTLTLTLSLSRRSCPPT